MKFKYLLAIALACLVLVALPVAAPPAKVRPPVVTMPDPLLPTFDGVIPIFYSGNDDPCALTGEYAVSFRVKWNETINTWEDGDGSFEIYDSYGDLVGTLHYSDPQYLSGDPPRWMVDWYVDGGTFSGQIRVKGGPGYLTYDYTDNAEDMYLYGPMNPGGNWAEISHITFCGYFTPDEEECWCDETAWADGDRYVEKGSWATFTPYVPETSVTLYAGQTLDAGDVSFSSAVDGNVTITITLNAGWRFADANENVKIQDYTTAPSGNPSPGGFAYKYKADESPFSTGYKIPLNNYYGVHIDVEQLCECPTIPAS